MGQDILPRLIEEKKQLDVTSPGILRGLKGSGFRTLRFRSLGFRVWGLVNRGPMMQEDP